MPKKSITLVALARMTQNGFAEVFAHLRGIQETGNTTREDLETLREDVRIVRSDMEAAFQDLKFMVRPLATRVDTHDMVIHDLQQRIDRLEKRHQTRGR